MLARVSAKGRLEVLREPGFRRLFLGRTTSLVGDGMAPVAIAFAVLHLNGSATDIGVVFAAHSAPATGSGSLALEPRSASPWSAPWVAIGTSETLWLS